MVQFRPAARQGQAGQATGCRGSTGRKRRVVTLLGTTAVLRGSALAAEAFVFGYALGLMSESQLHPLVVPQDSQTKQEPAGRMRTPQVEQ